jgi:hypothetical protein
MREIINHHEIVFIITNAENRQGPQITVNKIKGMLACEEEKGSLT